MSLKLNSPGGGSITLQEPTTASDRVLNLPNVDGTVVTTGSSAVVSQTMMASGVAGTGPAFSAYAGSVSVSANTSTKVPVSTKLFDTANCYDNTTNFRFTPNVAGYYQISASVEANAFAANYFVAQLKKNGTQIFGGSNYPTTSSAGPQTVLSCLVYMNGTTDYLELFAQASAGFSVVSGFGTTFQGVMVRAA